MLATLGLQEGSRIAITLKQGQLLLSPLDDQLHQELERIRDLVAAASGPSLSEILAELRQEQEERGHRLLG